MNKTLSVLILGAFLTPVAVPVLAQVHVDGYTRRDGTYVQPHERTRPNDTLLDNYSTRGNVNPYTGQPGTRDPDALQNQSPVYHPPVQSPSPYGGRRY